MAKVNPIQVQKFLRGVDYPASKQDLLHRAEQAGADENVRQALEHMPSDHFNSPNDVSAALGKIE